MNNKILLPTTDNYKVSYEKINNVYYEGSDSQGISTYSYRIEFPTPRYITNFVLFTEDKTLSAFTLKIVFILANNNEVDFPLNRSYKNSYIYIYDSGYIVTNAIKSYYIRGLLTSNISTYAGNTYDSILDGTIQMIYTEEQ